MIRITFEQMTEIVNQVTRDAVACEVKNSICHIVTENLTCVNDDDFFSDRLYYVSFDDIMQLLKIANIAISD